jgi:microcystin-dependent protein
MRTEGYFGEIRLFAGDTVPENWLPCNGQLVQISGNQALYSVFGNAYGGDGRTNFALPDLRARIPVSADRNHGEKLRAASHSPQIRKEEQPLLALSFCICMDGIYPSR